MAENSYYVVRVGKAHVQTTKTLKQAQTFAAGEISIVKVTQTWDDTTDDAAAMNMSITEEVV